MELLKFIPLYVVIVTMVAGIRRMMTEEDTTDLAQRQLTFSKNSRVGPIMCAKLAKEPYFGVDLLLGQTWRIYYAWNMDLQNHCIDVKFRKATPSIVNHMFHDMGEYLKTDPRWDAPSVLLKMGRNEHEMLMFADQLSAGRFQGVPNIMQDRSVPIATASVPLLNFHLKFIHEGKYLLMADCQTGMTTLLAHKKNIPYRADIAKIAKTLNFGPGFQACLTDKHRNEN